MASKAKDRFSSTEEDIYRNQAFESTFGAQFFKPFSDKSYEYQVKESTIDRKKHDPKYQERQKLMKTYEDTLRRNNILVALMRKRPLNPAETKAKRLLEAKLADDSINEEEERELKALRVVELHSEDDRNAQEIFRGINDIHYYLEARKFLKAGMRALEWDKSVTMSMETLEVDETKRCTTAVIHGDLIVESTNQLTKGFKPLVVCWGSRLSPGSNWDKGVVGIEEELFFRSSASVAFTDDITGGFYPLKDEGLLFARKIFAYRSPYSQSFELLKDQKKTFFSLALCSPEHLSPECKELTEEQEERLKAKLRNVFQTALYWGFDSIIMTPIGAGAPFNYPAESVTNIYKYVLFGKKNQFCHRFKRITFVSADPASDATVLAVLPQAERILKTEEIMRRERTFEFYKRELNGMTHEV